ncbi:MAG: 50S ribosomal protein L17 [Candidatus Liptonbacteria bacterium]|nr:50S ribosomal protein L17 [Candidatus Liptonbacteria bacterium]
MQHQHRGRTFHRKKGQRAAFLKGLVGNLVVRGSIVTTIARAKEIRPLAERAITTAKKQNVAALRILKARYPRTAAEKLYYEIAPRFKDRRGGYTRIVKQGAVRKRDGVPTARIEFLE